MAEGQTARRSAGHSGSDLRSASHQLRSTSDFGLRISFGFRISGFGFARLPPEARMNFANPHFAEPRWLWLAVLAPLVLVALQRYSAWARRRQLAQLAAPEFLKELIALYSPARRAIKNALLVLAAAGVGVALARPQWGEQAEMSHLFGQDTLFILDCSRSMLASDVAPSRLQRAKLAILDYVQRYGHGRVGLVAFAGQAFLQCPLTFDYGAFQDALMAVDDRTIPVPGTDIGRALDEASQRGQEASARRFLCCSPTARTSNRAASARRSAGQGGRGGVHRGCRHTGRRGDPFPERARQTGLVRDSRGEVVRSRLDEATLRAIAQATHGAYIPLVRWGGPGQSSACAGVAGHRPGSAPARKLGVDRFHWPVAGVLVLLVAESLIGTRRRLRDIGS